LKRWWYVWAFRLTPFDCMIFHTFSTLATLSGPSCFVNAAIILLNTEGSGTFPMCVIFSSFSYASSGRPASQSLVISATWSLHTSAIWMRDVGEIVEGEAWFSAVREL
jgi:hypothetical protein